MEIDSEDTPNRLAILLEKIESGEEIIIKRGGRNIARIKSDETLVPFTGLKAFRASIKIEGKPLSQTVIDMRQNERF